MNRSPWRWVPTLYTAQGLPYVVVTTLAVVLYKNLGLDNTAIALYTSWLYLPWVVKPLWSPLVELLRTRRWWVVLTQLLVGAALAAVALTLPLPRMLQLSLALFWLLALASATHDIAADGFYLLALPPHQQAAFVGVRSLFYRVAMIGGQGGLVVAAGQLTDAVGVVRAWQLVFGLLGGLFVMLALWHRQVLPQPAADRPAAAGQPLWAGAAGSFVSFFRRGDIGRVLAFLLLFRLGEAQLVRLVAPFLLDPRAQGGLGLTTAQLGLAYGTVGVAALTAGGLLGGWVISRQGLARCLWPMLLAIHVPNLLFVALAAWQPQQLALVTVAVAAEQFGYGFGFAAYLMFMVWVAQGHNGHSPTAHYAICTGFMALGMMLPGMAAGWLQQRLGYTGFFTWVCLATLPSFVAAALLRLPADFGRQPERA